MPTLHPYVSDHYRVHHRWKSALVALGGFSGAIAATTACLAHRSGDLCDDATVVHRAVHRRAQHRPAIAHISDAGDGRGLYRKSADPAVDAAGDRRPIDRPLDEAPPTTRCRTHGRVDGHASPMDWRGGDL